MDNITQKIKDKAKALSVDLVGIAGVDRFNDAPEGKRPTDLLPGAKSVISFGIRMLDGITQSLIIARETNNASRIQGLFGTYGCTTIPSFHLGNASAALANYIQNELGGVALPTTSGAYQTMSAFSQRRAAVAAGLGEMGWLGYVLTPEFGPRVIWGSVITTLELEEDPLYNGPKLCDPEKCHVCSKVCPANALPADKAVEYTIAGQKQCIGALDKNRCKAACLGLVKTLGSAEDRKVEPAAKSHVNTRVGSQDHSAGYTSNVNVRVIDYSLVDINREMSDEEFEDILRKTPMEYAAQALQAYPNWKCSLCMAYCPVGNWKGRFVPTGCTKQSGDFEV